MSKVNTQFVFRDKLNIPPPACNILSWPNRTSPNARNILHARLTMPKTKHLINWSGVCAPYKIHFSAQIETNKATASSRTFSMTLQNYNSYNWPDSLKEWSLSIRSRKQATWYCCQFGSSKFSEKWGIRYPICSHDRCSMYWRLQLWESSWNSSVSYMSISRLTGRTWNLCRNGARILRRNKVPPRFLVLSIARDWTTQPWGDEYKMLANIWMFS